MRKMGANGRNNLAYLCHPNLNGRAKLLVVNPRNSSALLYIGGKRLERNGALSVSNSFASAHSSEVPRRGFGSYCFLRAFLFSSASSASLSQRVFWSWLV